MGGLQTTLCRISISLIASGLAPPLTAQTLRDPIAVFATCTGRLSAVMEFQWLVQDPSSDITRDRRDTMAELLAAVTGPEDESRAMALRIDAKVAQTRLLHQARFDSDGTGRAQLRAAQLVAECADLALS